MKLLLELFDQLVTNLFYRRREWKERYRHDYIEKVVEDLGDL